VNGSPSGGPKNPVDPRPWVIAISNGRNLIGQTAQQFTSPPRGGFSLRPVYEVQPQAQMNPQTGQIAVSHLVVPLLLLAGLKSVDVPEGAIIIPLDELSRNERSNLMAGIENCQAMIRAARLAESGIAVPTQDQVSKIVKG
jgi:hypothetical protein